MTDYNQFYKDDEIDKVKKKFTKKSKRCSAKTNIKQLMILAKELNKLRKDDESLNIFLDELKQMAKELK